MRLITFASLRQFGDKHPQTMMAISAWYKIVKSRQVNWKKPQDVINTFGVARVDILSGDRVCINLGGNNVRIILKVEYGYGIAFVRWIGWHKDYDQLGDRIFTI
ncbi:MAG TPA: type II toxin-antitoxin system HigB family toxin [Saprospiraceae bacterium]